MWLFVEPTDVWLFRDGKPFDAGADHRARSLFPPHPVTLAGAIRRKVLAIKGIAPDDVGAVKRTVGDARDMGSLRLRGPFVARREVTGIVPYFPCPADVVNSADCALYLKIWNQNEFLANWPGNAALYPIVYDSAHKLSDKQYWLTAHQLADYLETKPIEGKLAENADLFEREGRLGIGIDGRAKRPAEGLLYQAEYIRAKDGVGLLVEVTGLEETATLWNQTGLLSLGGEMRAARYEVLSTPPDLPQGISGQERFKVYLATPTYFDAGWKSSQWATRPGWALTAAALGRAQTIGGWDVALNRQKVMRRYVPAGSVYYFEGPSPLDQVSMCDDAAEGYMGFGHYFTGRW